MMHENRFIALARVASPHGVSGRVKLKLFTESVESFTQHLPHLTYENGEKLTLKITGEAGGMMIAAIESVTNRTQAEQIGGSLLGVSRAHLPETQEFSYYVEDLIGLALTRADGSDFGRITAVENFGSGDIVSIQTVLGEELMLPLTHQNFPEIDVKRGVGIVSPPDIIRAEQSRADEEL